MYNLALEPLAHNKCGGISMPAYIYHIANKLHMTNKWYMLLGLQKHMR